MPAAEVETAWSPHPKQVEALVRCEYEVLYGGARGGGKYLSNSSYIATPKGWKLNGDIKIGDDIINPETGGSQKVIQVFPQGEMDIYQITFDDGAKTKVSIDHLWAYKLPNHARPLTKKSKQREYLKKEIGIDTTPSGRYAHLKLATTEFLRENLEQGCAPRIPLTAPILYTTNGRTGTGDIPAYFIGLMLGDGTLSKKVSIGLSTNDNEIAEYIENICPVGLYKEKNIIDINIYKDSVFFKKFYCYLNNNKLFGTYSDTKFIPEYVFTAPIDYRIDLLGGILDTDGYVDDRGHVEFTSTSYKLAKGVQTLVWGLGGKATISEPIIGVYKNERGERIECKEYWRVYIWLAFASKVFKLKRKIDRCVDKWNGGYENMRKVIDISYVGKEEATCIKVASSHGLYITDNFIVTHNTDAGMIWLTYPHLHSGYRGLVIRRHADDLRDWVDRVRIMYGDMAEVVGSPPEIRFRSGAKIRTGHLKDEGAYTKYLGHEYQRILIEELTLIPDEISYIKLISCCRSTIEAIEPQVFATTNPGNIGHHWVKARFIDICPWGTPYVDSVTGKSRVFIHAKIEDNPTLMKTGYDKWLDGLPPGLKEAWREGSWDFVEDMCFHELTDRSKYLIDVKNPPDRLKDLFDFEKMTPRDGVKVFRSFDWGYSAPFCCLWSFPDYEGRLHFYREMYGNKKGQNVGIQLPTRDIAINIKDIEDAHGERPILSIADASIYDKPANLHEKAEKLPSHAEIMGQEGIWFDEQLSKDVKKPHSILSGVGQIHERLRIDADGMAGMYVFSTLVNWWRTMTALPVDLRKPEIYDTEAEDHPADCTRYILLARPFKTTQKRKRPHVDSLEFINKNFYHKEKEREAW